MVHDTFSQRKSEDYQRCFPARVSPANSDVQFSRIQRLIVPAIQIMKVNMLILYLDSKIVYRRYASLFFIAGCSSTDNELITLEIVHRYVEQMDKYYGNVCELDIIFNFQKAYFILDELLLAGEMQESSKKNVLRCISQQDSLEDMEVSGA
jgi:AP-1 complex subunit sigma 1/2